MTRFAIWNDANCSAARSPRVTFFETNSAIANDVNSVHYAQQIFRGQPPLAPPGDTGNRNPRFRLDETLLPDGTPIELVTANLLPSDSGVSSKFRHHGNDISFDDRRLSGLVGMTDYALSGRTLTLADIYTFINTAQFPNGNGFFQTPLVVSEGRHKAVHRMRGALLNFRFVRQFVASEPMFGPSPNAIPVDFASFVDALGTAFALRTTHVPLLVMCVPKLGGTVTMSGVYAALRPVLNKAQLRPDGKMPVNYLEPRLPGEASLIEIGQFQDTAFTSRAQLVVFAGGIPAGVNVDWGLARDKLWQESDTTLSCVLDNRQGYVQAIEFPYAPPDADHALCGTLSGNVPSSIASRVVIAIPSSTPLSLVAQQAAGKQGFNAGECPAFEKHFLDHGILARVPFWAGAPRSRHWTASNYGNANVFRNAVNIAPQWSAWEQSQFPYTMHKTGSLTIDGTVVPLEDLDNARALNTPIYDFADYVFEPWQTVEHFPSYVVTAKAARVQALAQGSHYEDSSMKLGKARPDGKMLFGGKVINSVAVEFIPYSRGNSIFTGIATATPVPASTIGTSEAFSSSRFVDGFYSYWWRLRQIVARPQGAFGRDIYQGEFIRRSRLLSDGKTVSTPDAFTEVSAETEKTAYVLAACFADNSPSPAINVNSPHNLFNLDLGIDRYRLGRTSGAAWEGVGIAPLTGRYTMDRFTLGGVPTAGNLFKYSGTGEWEANQTASYNYYAEVTSVDDAWGAQGFAVLSRSPSVAAVPIAEDWKMNTDHVELYCSLGAALQQAGNFQPDPPVPFLDLPEAEAQPLYYAAQRNWLKQTFLHHDRPRGRLSDTVVYVDGLEPSPVLTITIRFRTAMRAELTCSVDTSSLPEYPHSMSNASSAVIENSVRGLHGIGNVSGDQQTTESHHDYKTVSFTFNKEQTAQLMNGEEVLAMQWQAETSPQRPEFADTGGIFLHAFKVQLDVSPA
jgi:hypothetical protein